MVTEIEQESSAGKLLGSGIVTMTDTRGGTVCRVDAQNAGQGPFECWKSIPVWRRLDMLLYGFVWI